MRHKRASNQGITRTNLIFRVNEQLLTVGNHVLFFSSVDPTNNNNSLATLLLSDQFDFTVDLSNDCRFFRLSCFKELGHPWQTTSDVLSTRGFTRILGKYGPCRNLLSFNHFNTGTFRKVIEVENRTGRVFQHNLRMQFTLMLNDRLTDVAAGVFFRPNRLAFNQVLKANFTAHFAKDRDRVLIPGTEDLTDDDGFILGNLQHSACWNCITFEFAVLGIDHDQLAVSTQHDALAIGIHDAANPCQTNLTISTRFNFTFLDVLNGHPTNVERSHRQLSTRFTDTLCGDDPNRQALFHQRTG